MENKYTKLAKNTAMFAIGSFGSKVLSFLIVPLYTYVLTTEEYGQIDLFTTTVGLLLPFVTLSIQEALLRFMMGKEISEKVAINNSFLIFAGGSFLSLLAYPLYKVIFGSGQYFVLFWFFIILNSFTQIFGQFLRAVGDMVAFTANGVLVTIVTLISNLILVLYLRKGMEGYLYSLILAQTASMVYILATGKILKNISFKCVDIVILKEMLKYCAPLIPNSLMWWVMSGGDKYIINYSLGNGANGLYSLAMKIPSIISMVYALFYQAWQMSAIEESSRTGEKSLYENVFKVTTALLVIMVSGIVLCVKPLYLTVMGANFHPAWPYVPMLCFATIFSCYGSFFGVIYAVNKQTKRAFTTTLMGAIVNLMMNFLLISSMGLQGVAVGTCMGYLAVALVRAKDTYKEISMSFDITRMILAMGILLLQIILTIYVVSIYVYIIGVFCLVILLLIYKQEFIQILSIIMRKVNRKG